MTERHGTVEGRAGEFDESIWRVEGSDVDTYGDGGLGDTVVRLPRIPADGPAPELPPPPKPRPAAKPRAKARPAEEAPRPAEPAADEQTRVRPVAAPVPSDHGGGAPSFAAPAAFAGPTAFAAAAPAAAVTAPPATGTLPVATPTAPGRKPKASGLRRTRKARLRLSKVDPWSVMKTSFLFSIAFGIMFWVAVSVVWTVIVSSGLFEVVNQSIVDLLSSPTSQSTWRIEDYINTNKVLGITALLAVINVVIATALGTLTAFLYNLSANILGGLELTLAED